jgi:hypothetical protein
MAIANTIAAITNATATTIMMRLIMRYLPSSGRSDRPAH